MSGVGSRVGGGSVDEVETRSFDTSETDGGTDGGMDELGGPDGLGGGTFRTAPGEGPWPATEAPTVERSPLIVGLVEEDAPLDRDATERELLAAIATGDEGSRAVYADWLEERSEHARAGFLRLEQVVWRMTQADPRLDACTRQLRELSQHIGAEWRARVARPVIEGCPQFEFRCPKRWDALALTEEADVRYCGACAKNVYYFESVDEAREAARGGYCVAIGLGSERWESDFVDIGTRCWSCSRRIVSSARFCPHCGESQRRSLPPMVGRMAIDD